MHYRSLVLCLSVCSCATRIHVTRTPARECFSQEMLRQRGVYTAAEPDLQQPLEEPQAAPAHGRSLIGLDRLKKKSASMAGEKKLTDLMEEEGSIGAANPKLSLSLPDYVAHEILVWAQTGECVNSSQVRHSLKNKQRLRGNPKLAVIIQNGIAALVDAGVVKPVADDDVRVVVAPKEEAGEVEMEVEAGAKAKPKTKGKAKAKKGRNVVRFEKCSWIEVSARPQALALVTRLLLTADNFMPIERI